VYVNGQMASRKGEYFRRELSVNNAGGPVWLGVTVTSPGEPTVTGNLFVPRTPEVFTHDPDGNLTSDGRWTYTWDAENRLVQGESRSDVPSLGRRQVVWQYDAQGRRIRQTTSTWLMQSNLWVVTEDLKFLSDPLLFGRHVVDLNASNNVPLRSYVWGLDLSGTLEGSGGVGGLLWVTLHTGSGAGVGTHFCAYDGNGNVVALASASDGSATGRYEYGPFGEPIRVTGPAAALNPFRFSTKRTCNNTDLVLYEYRAYSPALGRWLSRDPIMESAVWNLYAMVLNDPVGTTDFYGLQRIEHWVQDQWTTLYVDVINKIGGTRYIAYGHYLLVWGESVNGRKFHAFGKDSADSHLRNVQPVTGSQCLDQLLRKKMLHAPFSVLAIRLNILRL